MAAPYGGQCLCGAVRYRIDAEPLAVYTCHCTDCQRRTGSAFAFTVVVARPALQVLCGETAPYFARLPDGRVKQGRMCAPCGTRLWGEGSDPNLAFVTHGTLDQPSGLAPVAHLWVRSRQPWLAADAACRRPSTRNRTGTTSGTRTWRRASRR
jgi:hypothetical protein